MAKKLLAFLLLLTLVFTFVACDSDKGTDASGTSGHKHTYGKWETVKEATTTEKGLQERVCTCGEKETKEIEKLPAADTTVTAQEWISAFDLSRFNNYTFSINELCAEEQDNETYGIRGTVTVTNGIGYKDMVEFYDTNENVRQGYISGLIANLDDLDGDWLSELYFELEYAANYGYAGFTYSSNTASYHQNIDVDDIPCDVNVYFENAKIVKITMVGRSTDSSLNCTYTFAYN